MRKRLSMMLGLLAAVSFAYGQAQNPECMQNLSIFAEHAKVKNYEAAFEPWKMVFETCPELHFATYAYGEKILKDRIKNDEANKPAYINTLMEVYKKGPEYFPKRYTKAGSMIDIALLKFDNDMANDEELFSLLDEAFKEDAEHFKNPKALYLYFSTLVDLHKAGKKDLQEVFDTYDAVTGKISEENRDLAEIIMKYVEKDSAGTLTSKEKTRLKNARINGESYEKISSSIDSKLGGLADCENLIPLYQKNFDSHKNDAKWLRSAAGRMDDKGCTGDPMFVKLVEALDALEPSAQSKYFLGSLYEEQGDRSKALDFFNQSVELETDKYKKATKLLSIASKAKKRGQKTTAYKYAKQSLSVNPSEGRAYMLIASLYADSANECGTNTFEKKAVYWRAAAMARKAGQVDPSMGSSASKAAAAYEGRAPSRSEIFNSGMQGQSIKFNCWVGGSVKVPSL
ncbi:tetratricopeptide repeat protein [Robertkochia sediminum]|uniref:tetratricopeptide repeat protein n=1 Tax=Robertkochia sediminum TaxID=2785326 RepID=UPI00193296D7|nr:hypothetical protein [Robertkochia sediminum]MBL7473003.1 hypothetical protein [Robertkochia sediminum]